MTIEGAIGAGAVKALLYVWFATVLVSALYVAVDAFTKNPELTVMKWGWVLVTLYIGPIGASLYVLSCQEPRPGTHERFVAPLWKQTLGSTIHCVAGDASGIVVAAIITTSIGLPMWGDTIVEMAQASGSGCSSSRRCGERLSEPAPVLEPAGHAGMDMSKPRATRAQVNAVAVLTIVVLVAGVVLAAALGDFAAWSTTAAEREDLLHVARRTLGDQKLTIAADCRSILTFSASGRSAPRRYER